MIDVKINIDARVVMGKINPTNYSKFMNTAILDISNKWKKTRYGVASSQNPSVSSLTNLLKGKDSPMLESGQLRASQRVESNSQGKFIIGTDKVYGAMLMHGGKWTAKKVFVIPCTPDAKRMLKRLQKMKSVIAELRSKYSLEKNRSSIFSNKKGVFLVRKIGKTGYNWTRLFIFRKTIAMPKREIFYIDKNDETFLKAAIKGYFNES